MSIDPKDIELAFQLGQTYWQQADSEYASQNKKAGATMQRYRELLERVRSAIEVNGQPQERGEAVTAYEADKAAFDSWLGRNYLDDEGGRLALRMSNPTELMFYAWRARAAHPAPDAGRVAELEAECKRLREEVHAHASNEVDFAEQNAALEAQLAESREREGRMREALEESVALTVNWVATAEPEHLAHLSEYKAVIAMGEAALAADKEGE